MADEEMRRDEVDAYEVFVQMELLLDKLKLLNFETDFCSPEKVKPFSRHYFALAGNTSEQLYHFGKIMSWLLLLTGQRFQAPDQFEDPNTICTTIMLELKKQGIATNFPPSKLRAGFGEEICQVLNTLAQNALKAKRWKFSKPIFAADDYQEDTTLDEDIEVTADKVAEEEIEDNIDEDDDTFISAETVARNTAKADSKQVQDELTESAVDQTAWRLEVESVLPQLKIVVKADTKVLSSCVAPGPKLLIALVFRVMMDQDWRQHLESMHEHEKTMADAFGKTKAQLDKLHAEIARAIEKMDSRDKYINAQLEGLIHEYRNQQDALTSHSNRYKQASTGVNQLTKELAKMADELETIKQQTDERGASITDSAPVVKIKQSLTKLKAEISQIDLRIGVLQHTLLMSKVRAKSSILEQMNADVDTSDMFA
eukprot:m.108569 g.108569  ORF g.108569 m.108569 type:complete len:427 (+) comp51742_c0_seq4:91-1371(+)